MKTMPPLTALVILLLLVPCAQNARAEEGPRITSLVEWFRTGKAFTPGNRVHPDRRQVQPLLDHPLRDPSICKGPDGWYYLTGTDGTPILPEYGPVDFQNNDGIRVWRSKDLENWEFVTQALDLSLESLDLQDDPGRLRYWRRVPDNEPRVDGDWVRGVQAPEIHYINETFWIVYSMNGNGGGILKSTTGKAEGPYVDWALQGTSREGWGKGESKLFALGGSPSLFQDDPPSPDGSGEAGGAVYLLWGDGKIARLKDDLSGLAELPRMLLSESPARTGELLTDFPLQVGRDGYFLKKMDGRYYLFATDLASRGGEAAEDVYVAWSDTIYGPYSERRWSIPHAGQTTIFAGPDGEMLASYCGNDPHAAFRDRAGIVELEWTKSDHPHKIPPEERFPRRLLNINTERYLWHRLPAVAELPIRDTQACRGPDGAIYYTGSHVTKETEGRLFIWKSTDMVNWEPIEIWDWDRQKEYFEEPVADPRESKRPQVFSFMDTEIWYLGDTFYVFYSIYTAKPAHYILKSTTGKAEGPYEVVSTQGPSQPSFFQDPPSPNGSGVAGGAIYEGTNRKIFRWMPDLSGRAQGVPMRRVEAADGSLYIGDAAGQLTRIKGKYVYFNCGVDGVGFHGKFTRSDPGAYTWAYQTADSLDGPWSREQVIGPHSGHGSVVEDRFGNWWVCSFANESSQGQPCMNVQTAYIHPLDVRTDENGELIMRMADTFPDYVEKALREREASGDSSR